ncbi:glycosyltransferase [Sphingomonas sp.]|uniref:glycosyltransferase n=1 Tax=Sphingomonas sp. TaxID=28214 RepID=UPI000DB1580D|nr:glycosyltransferase [Sphingomonas sp.]PZU09744.1 MAG: glycosyl transferase family 1 [Sphingomonas sp.]
MRIVDVCAFYAPQGGGVRTYVERKLAAASLGDHEMIVVAPGASDGTIREMPGGRIVTLSAPSFPLDRRYRYFDNEPALHDLLDELAPDIVEASSPWSSASMVGRWRGAALRSLVMHADPLAAYPYRWFGSVASRRAIDRGFDFFWRHLRRLDARFDMVVSASESLSSRLVAGGLSKVRTIPMGVDPGLFSPALRDEALRAKLLERCGLGPDATLLLGLGRHAPEKRWPMVIDAAVAAGYGHPIGLLLIGDGRDRARVVRAAGHNPHIHLGAPVTDRRELAAILASADALVHGCEAETFCITAAEARASGLPLIVPDEGGASDQAREGQGFRYRSRSAASLTAAIRRFVTEDRDGHRARAKREAGQVRSMDSHFRDLIAAYEGARAIAAPRAA